MLDVTKTRTSKSSGAKKNRPAASGPVSSSAPKSSRPKKASTRSNPAPTAPQAQSLPSRTQTSALERSPSELESNPDASLTLVSEQANLSSSLTGPTSRQGTTSSEERERPGGLIGAILDQIPEAWLPESREPGRQVGPDHGEQVNNTLNTFNDHFDTIATETEDGDSIVETAQIEAIAQGEVSAGDLGVDKEEFQEIQEASQFLVKDDRLLDLLDRIGTGSVRGDVSQEDLATLLHLSDNRENLVHLENNFEDIADPGAPNGGADADFISTSEIESGLTSVETLQQNEDLLGEYEADPTTPLGTVDVLFGGESRDLAFDAINNAGGNVSNDEGISLQDVEEVVDALGGQRQ